MTHHYMGQRGHMYNFNFDLSGDIEIKGPMHSWCRDIPGQDLTDIFHKYLGSVLDLSKLTSQQVIELASQVEDEIEDRRQKSDDESKILLVDNTKKNHETDAALMKHKEIWERENQK